MKSLLKAIKAKWNLDATLHLDFAPQGTASPYGVFFTAAGRPVDTFNTRMDSSIIQFSLFSDAAGSEEILDLGAALEALYDYCSLSLESGGLVEMRRNGTPVLSRNPDDGSWEWRLDFRVIFSK